jgi:RimJ/RimL family protein N-acetyltransferase
MTPQPRLETDRLVLRPFLAEDFESFARMCADREVMRYINDGRALTRGEAWRALAMFAGHWGLRGYGQWAVVEKATGAFIGRAGLWNPEGWPGLEVGWFFDRARWGHGFATEAGLAALDWAFRVLGAERVISVIHPKNVASIRVAERLGERFERAMVLDGGIEVVVYGRRRPG